MQRIPVSKFRDSLSELINQVAFGGETVMLERHGRTVGVVISPAEYQAFLTLQGVERPREVVGERAIEPPAAAPEPVLPAPPEAHGRPGLRVLGFPTAIETFSQPAPVAATPAPRMVRTVEVPAPPRPPQRRRPVRRSGFDPAVD